MRAFGLLKVVVTASLLLTFSSCERPPAASSTPAPEVSENESSSTTEASMPSSDKTEESAASSSQSTSDSAKTTTAKSKENSDLEVVDDLPPNPVLASGMLTAAEIEDGWISLFDGHSLFGWKSTNDEIHWKVEKGAITADVGPVGFLMTTVPFADFEIICEFQLSEGGNSGLFLRSTFPPGDIEKDCYEINIADEQPEGYLTGSIVRRQRANTPITGSGGWKTLRVVAMGNTFEVFVDGNSVVTYTDESKSARSSGLIGLQQRFGTISFRKIILKPLNMTPLFNGEDLAGWREVPGSKSTFTVKEEAIHVENGPGFLETEGTYDDFIFQATARTNAKELNSGFFFRAEPGTEKAPSNGYEAQIHNGTTNGNRSKPNNAGTGAIFRRVEARRVVADDLHWFTTTLVAAGPRIAVWVDGYQVVDWEDTRKPDPNPRKGQRLEAGHISLQGHDPTTDVDFRNLKIAPLSAKPDAH